MLSARYTDSPAANAVTAHVDLPSEHVMQACWMMFTGSESLPVHVQSAIQESVANIKAASGKDAEP